MRKLLALAAALGLLLAPASFGADTPAVTGTPSHGCTQYTLCDAYNITGGAICENADGNQIVATLRLPSNLTFEHDESVGNHTCDIIVNKVGVAAAVGTPGKINTSSLTQANLAPATATGGIKGKVWASCSVGASVTIYMTACPIN